MVKTRSGKRTTSNSNNAAPSGYELPRTRGRAKHLAEARNKPRMETYSNSESDSYQEDQTSKSKSRYNTRSRAARNQRKPTKTSASYSTQMIEQKDEEEEEYIQPNPRRRMTRSQTKQYQSVGQKRKLSHAQKEQGTPPNKKKAISRVDDDSPSQMLSKQMSKINLKSKSKSKPKARKRKAKAKAKAKRKRKPRAKIESESDESQSESDSESSDETKTNCEYNLSKRSMDILHVQQLLLTHEMKNHQLKGREVEYDTILQFLTTNLGERQCNSFYICGSPGTGKTATMAKIEHFLNNSSNKRKLNIQSIIKMNAMRFSKPQFIYSKLYQQIVNTSKNINAHNAIEELNSILIQKERRGSGTRKMIIVIVDECDGLLASQPTVLYQLFLWCKKKHSKLILIGIANSIDLTDRFLPRLRARNCEPELLIFKPYTKQQLVQILKHRLLLSCRSIKTNANDDGLPYFEQVALELCAQKVAKMYGDLRKCLEICRSSLSILIDDESKEKIGFLEMRKVLKQSFSSPLVEVIRQLPNHQKILIVISSILCEKCCWITESTLESFYKYVVAKFSLPKCSSSEYSIMKDSLIADGILKLSSSSSKSSSSSSGAGGRKKSKKRGLKLQMIVPQCDVQFAVEEHKVLTSLFESNFQIPNKYLD